MINKLCLDKGISIVVTGKRRKGKSYEDYQAEIIGTSWKGKLNAAVDALIPQVSDFEELLQSLQVAGLRSSVANRFLATHRGRNGLPD